MKPNEPTPHDRGPLIALATSWAEGESSVPLTAMNPNPRLARFLVEAGAFEEPYYLIDVGASGGLEDHWGEFGDSLVADGFDPLVAEVARLSQIALPHVHYWCAFVGDGEGESKSVGDTRGSSNSQFAFTTAAKFGELTDRDYVAEVFNSGSEVEYSQVNLTLDEFVADNDRPIPAFVKIDTDGSDIEVIRGAKKLLSSSSCIGLQVECQFHGVSGSRANTFANIDLLLRELGYTLIDIDIWRYSRHELPLPFHYEIPAQTDGGGVQWGEALYLRDPTTSRENMAAVRQSPVTLASLLATADLYGAVDFAASVLVNVMDQSESIAWLNPSVLDLVVPPNPWGFESYEEYFRQFTDDPSSFFPSRIAAVEASAELETVRLERAPDGTEIERRAEAELRALQQTLTFRVRRRLLELPGVRRMISTLRHRSV